MRPLCTAPDAQEFSLGRFWVNLMNMAFGLMQKTEKVTMCTPFFQPTKQAKRTATPAGGHFEARWLASHVA